VRLSEYAVGRDNNFTLLRFSAAMTVLFAHSVAVLGLPPDSEFFYKRLGFSLGEMGLDMLFVTSGFLVTASLVVRQDLIAYLWARILRVYPGMWVMLVLTVFVLAPALTSLPRGAYYASPLTWEYFRKCATLLGGVRYSLPGVFDNLPLKGEFNGSLWTMPVEVRMYLYLAAIYVALAVAPALRLKAMRVVLPISAAVLIAIVLSQRLTGGAYNGANIRVFMFLYGSSLFVWREKIPLGAWLLGGILAALVLASFDKTIFFVVYAACLAPLVLHLVYVPGGLFLWRLYLCFPGAADAGLPLSGHDARGDDGFVRVRVGRDRDRIVEADRGARSRQKGRVRRGDVARVQSWAGEDRLGAAGEARQGGRSERRAGRLRVGREKRQLREIGAIAPRVPRKQGRGCDACMRPDEEVGQGLGAAPSAAPICSESLRRAKGCRIGHFGQREIEFFDLRVAIRL
jgi:peptidoglycan/LPS O-acetylase OafA/YrhL